MISRLRKRFATARDVFVLWIFVAICVVTLVIAGYQRLDRESAPAIIVLPGLRATSITVEIAGAVAKPGAYTVPAQSRVTDGIDAAGGTLSNADLSGIDQAAFLMDGQKVTIPVAGNESNDSAQGIASGPVNINTATLDELVALPGIGEKRAQAIIDYRNQHGPFTSVDGLLAVEGLTEGVVDELRPLVTVGE